MTLAKKGTKPVQLPKSSLVYKKHKQAERAEQAEAERRKAEEIERMIEAKVNMALRRLLH
jgi:hypothetical protein